MRPHNNPSFLTPDFNNLSEGPHFNKTWVSTHNRAKEVVDASNTFNFFPKFTFPDNKAAERQRLKSAGLIPTCRLRTPQTQDQRRTYKMRPDPKIIPSKEEIELVQAAGVQTKFSPFMY